ncbi:hypothetical protein [Sutcliffiella rhizosphaerae]|uniref:Sporulation protein n=1 Tax=Sutcliffiella rhizosphaerae TaxID=2880967 RepID=A0ABM8YJY8_9BACI|nr:hypothetical protein [Sutcliffiella rhizosphaerae]CAG9620115.1 hypothetical protein BACCIP111883_00883 [Sutcliffiella rhizosphaerae]
MKHVILFLVVCSIFISGCSGHQRFGADEDFDGKKLIGVNNKEGFYRRDLNSEYYNTNQNPNFLDLSENRPDYGDDQNKFREVIEYNSDLEPGPVYITGHTARVTAYAHKDMTSREKKRLKRELQERFIEVVPRYQVHLTIKER